MIELELQAGTSKSKPLTMRRLLILSVLVVVALASAWEVLEFGAILTFRRTIATADRIVVRDRGFDRSDRVDNKAILFEVTDSSEIQAVARNLTFTRRYSVGCDCSGFPGIDWYQGDKRIALTEVKHREAILWDDGEFGLSEGFRGWLSNWLMALGLSQEEIERSRGDPRRDLPPRAANSPQPQGKSSLDGANHHKVVN